MKNIFTEEQERNIVKNWENIVSYMYNNYREDVHAELAPCTRAEFLTRYLELDTAFSIVLKQEFNIDV